MMMALMERLWPLHRTLVCDDMDRALDIIGEVLPDTLDYHINAYPTGEKVWTWTVPEKYEVDEAYLELLTPDGPQRIVDFADNSLHIVSYGPPFEGEISFDQLDLHLHTNPNRPDAIPWVFKFYDREWGFCLPHRVYEKLPRDGRYRVTMRTRFEKGHLRVGELTIPGKTDEMILIMAAVCHPWQVNDSISGVVTAVDLAHRLADCPPERYGIKMLFLPETIGSVAYFAHNEDLISRFKFGFFTEFAGNNDPIRLQRTRQDNHLLDRVVRRVLSEHFGPDGFIEGAYCHTIITNDEKVSNAPGVDIPTVALNRWPDEGWPLYHTTDDNPSAIVPHRLAEISDLYVGVIDILQNTVYPRRTFKGPLFLSGVDLGFEWKTPRKLKRAVQDISTSLEGNLSSFDIADNVDLPHAKVLEVLKAMENQGLVELSPQSWQPD